MKRLPHNSDTLLSLDLLIAKVGRKWKRYMRDLKSVPLSENTLAVVRLRLVGMSDAEIHDLNQVTAVFVERVTSTAIFEELRKRRVEGLQK